MIIVLSTIFSSFLSSTIIYRLHFNFIPLVISKASYTIAIETFVQLFKVWIYYGIFHIIYFAHFLIGFVWYASNNCASLRPYFSNCYSVVPFANIKAILVLIFATFPTIICDSSATFKFFCKRKRCSFLYGKVSLNHIINLLSTLFLFRGNCNISLLNAFEPGFLLSGFGVLGYTGFSHDEEGMTLSSITLASWLGLFTSSFGRV